MPIYKNDIVTNNIQLVAGYNNQYIVPAGTILKVYKATRNGAIYCSVIDRTIYHGTLTLKTTDVTKIEKPKANVKVDDIFVSSGGYEQTNVTFYKVITVKKCNMEIVEIGATRNYTGHMHGSCMPNINNIGTNNKTVRMRVDVDGTVSFKAIWGYARPWNGEAKYFSEWY